MKLVMIRHGLTKANEMKKYLGRTEEALSENGILEIHNRVKEGRYPAVGVVAASPMKRCVQTEELIYGSSAPILIKDWREIDFGDFEGKNYQELSGDPCYQRWIESGGLLPFPGGESREEFIYRCVFGFQNFCSMLKSSCTLPVSAAMVVHGGTIMAILSTFAGGDYFSYQCGNAEGFCCELELEPAVRIIGVEKL